MVLRVGNQRQTIAVTLTTSATLSASVDLGGYRVGAIEMPSAWTAANLTFQGSDNDTTFNNLYDQSGNELTVTAAASRRIVLDSAAALSLGASQYLKVRSGTAAVAVSQTTGRTINLAVEPA